MMVPLTCAGHPIHGDTEIVKVGVLFAPYQYLTGDLIGACVRVDVVAVILIIENNVYLFCYLLSNGLWRRGSSPCKIHFRG